MACTWQVAAALEGLSGRGKRPAGAAISGKELEDTQDRCASWHGHCCYAGLEPSQTQLHDCMQTISFIACQQLQ